MIDLMKQNELSLYIGLCRPKEWTQEIQAWLGMTVPQSEMVMKLNPSPTHIMNSHRIQMIIWLV